MELIGRKVLLKLKAKNKGNHQLTKAIDDLISDLETKRWKSKEEVKKDRPDADQVHSEGFYFFDIHIHRTMIMLQLEMDFEATIVWAGSHQEYEYTFKNSKSVIRRWLTEREWI